MKIYTKTGDDGTTGLFGGGRVPKSDPRIEAIGAVDEINACVGLAAVGADEPLLSQLRQIQNELFVVGSYLATPDPSRQAAALPPLEESIVRRLEREIDAAEAELPPLKQFILPGGTEVAARLHLARTVCRRAERKLVEFAANLSANPLLVSYLNRLSDWLFVMARLDNHRASIPDVPWAKP